MKHTAKLTACLLTMALTACSAAPQDAPASQTTAEPPAAGAQGILSPVYTTWGSSVGGECVYSAMNIDDAGQYYATSIDFATGEQRILCTKSGCTHSDGNCPAYMTSIQDGRVPVSALLPTDDRLY